MKCLRFSNFIPTYHTQCSGLLCSIWWQLLTNVLRQPIGSIFKAQEISCFLDFMALEDGSNRLS